MGIISNSYSCWLHTGLFILPHLCQTCAHLEVFALTEPLPEQTFADFLHPIHIAQSPLGVRSTLTILFKLQALLLALLLKPAPPILLSFVTLLSCTLHNTFLKCVLFLYLKHPPQVKYKFNKVVNVLLCWHIPLMSKLILFIL